MLLPGPAEKAVKVLVNMVNMVNMINMVNMVNVVNMANIICMVNMVKAGSHHLLLVCEECVAGGAITIRAKNSKDSVVGRVGRTIGDAEN